LPDSHDFESVDLFTVGAVGEPGRRTFLIQAVSGTSRVTVKCEKQQVAALSEYLQGVLADLPAVVSDTPVLLDLVPPTEPEWVAGTLSVAYDDVADRIVILVEEIGDVADEEDEVLLDEEERSSLRVRLTLPQVTALVDHTIELVEAGRPPCEICGHPKGPDHACPRTNGHGPPR
jgi:uncharacterized repeat protein (TIGR03847 family)